MRPNQFGSSTDHDPEISVDCLRRAPKGFKTQIAPDGVPDDNSLLPGLTRVILVLQALSFDKGCDVVDLDVEVEMLHRAQDHPCEANLQQIHWSKRIMSLRTQ